MARINVKRDGSECLGSLPAKDPQRNRYPCSVIWSPLPLMTWLFPFVGHVGICDSQGVCYDLTPTTVSVDDMWFAPAVKVWDISHLVFSLPLPKSDSREVEEEDDRRRIVIYDEAIRTATKKFEKITCCPHKNCCSFVGCAMETAQLGGNGVKWSFVKVAAYVFLFGSYVSLRQFLRAHLPFLFIALLLWIVVP